MALIPAAPISPSTLRGASFGGRSDYRFDIDLLRAVAVLSVVGFHWKIPGFPGGYVGVDIFFVISGFLITGLILGDLRRGTFSFVAFYERRVRRILPALYVMMAASAIVAWFALLPDDFTDFGVSVASTVAFVSNIYFWLQTGYFDKPLILKALLHTWSLSVEEQFYLVVPALLWLAMATRLARRFPKPVLSALVVVLFAASLLASQLTVHKHPSAAFYLAPFRAWEFFLGSILAILDLPAAARSLRLILAAAGGAAIATSIAYFTLDTPFPGLYALLPCGGAALSILAGRSAADRPPPWFARPGVFFGKISYSLYLYHWPVFVFAGLLVDRPNGFSPIEKLGMFLGTTALSYLSFRFVEQPPRTRRVLRPRRSLFAAVALCSMLFFILTGASLETGGFPDRLNLSAASLLSYTANAAEADYRSGTCFLQEDQPFSRYRQDLCAQPSAGVPNVLVWGDSLAAHYVPGLKATTDPARLNIMQATSAECIPVFEWPQPNLLGCNDLNQYVRSLVHQGHLSAVLISGNWRASVSGLPYDEFALGLRHTIAEIQAAHVPVLLMGPSIQWKQALPPLLVRHRFDAKQDFAPGVEQLDAEMQQSFTGMKGVRFVSILQLMCDHMVCPALATPNSPMEWDTVHLTANGSKRVAQRLLPAILETIEPRSRD